MVPWPVLAGALGSGAALKLWLTHQTKNKREQILAEYEVVFNAPKETLEVVKATMLQQMAVGLQGGQGGLMMLPSYVDVLPTGNEQGEFYGVDLGGTNLRVMWVRLGTEKGQVEAQDIEEWPIPDECYETDNGKLLHWVAEKAEEVMRRHDGITSIPTIGFCFSFACDQTSLGDGNLLLWTKSFKGKHLIGQDVVAALAQAFAARGIKVKIPALMNDTVATLIALRYSEQDTHAGIILGTGTNCAYLEKTDRILKLPPPSATRPRGPLMVINTEWGDLDSAGAALPRCEEDIWVDCSSANPGHGLFEKLIAGLYMGEVARRIMLKLVEHGELFGGTRKHGIGSKIAKEGSFGSADLSAIDQDESNNLEKTSEVLAAAFNIKKSHLHGDDRKVAQRVCRMVARRSARLCAAAIAAIIEQSGTFQSDTPFVISVDGSVFTKYPGYRVKLQEALVELLGESNAALVQLKTMDGGSVAGAAYLAAAALATSG